MLKKFMVAATLSLVAALAGCGGGGGGGGDPGNESGTPNRYYHRLVHVLPDGPPMALQAATTTLTATYDYSGASALMSRSLGGTSAEIAFSLDGVGPDGASIPDILASTFTVQGNTEYSFVATGQYDAPELVVVPNPRRDRPFDGLFFQFVHAATGAGPVDVYVTDPGTDLASTAPLATLGEREHTASFEVPFDDRRIRLTAPGTLDVVFDSGTLDFQEDDDDATDGLEWLITIANNLFVGGSPLKLIVSDGRQSDEFLQAGEAAALRVAHASEIFPTLDVVVGDHFASPLASALTYRERSVSGLVPAGRVSLNLTLPGEPGTFVYEDTITTGPGIEYTLFLVEEDGRKASFLTAANPRSVSTDARVRVINLAPESEFFSVYFGETANDPPLAAERRALDLGYTGFTEYFRLPPGAYQVTMTERFYEPGESPDDAEETITIGPFGFDAPAGSVTTMVILPPGAPGGPETLEIYDDLLP